MTAHDGRLLTVMIAAVLTSVSPLEAQTTPGGLDRLAGIWRLVSWDRQFDDGTSRRDPRTESYIIYTETGHMCFVAMDPDRPVWASGAPTEEEALSAIAGFAAYCGTVEVNLEESFIVHHVELELRPNSVDILRRRFFEFTGPDRIVLTVDPAELSPPVVASTVVWQRVVQ